MPQTGRRSPKRLLNPDPVRSEIIVRPCAGGCSLTGKSSAVSGAASGCSASPGLAPPNPYGDRRRRHGLAVERRRFPLTAIRTPKNQPSGVAIGVGEASASGVSRLATGSVLLGLGLAVMEEEARRRQGVSASASLVGWGEIAIRPELPGTAIASVPIVAIALVALGERPIGSRTPVRKTIALTVLPGGKASAIAAALTLGLIGRSIDKGLRGVWRQARLVETLAGTAGKRSAAPRAKRNDPTGRRNRHRLPSRPRPPWRSF